MGAVFVRDEIHDAFMNGLEELIEFSTAIPTWKSVRGRLPTLDTYEDEGFDRGADLAQYWEDRLHSLADHPHVIDIRNIGLIGAIELQPIEGAPTKAFRPF